MLRIRASVCDLWQWRGGMARSAILDDVLLELRENQQIMQADFNEYRNNFIVCIFEDITYE